MVGIPFCAQLNCYIEKKRDECDRRKDEVDNAPNEAERVDDEAIRPAGARVSKHSLRLTERDPVSRQGCAGRGRVSLRGINYFVVVKQGILGNKARGRYNARLVR